MSKELDQRLIQEFCRYQLLRRLILGVILHQELLQEVFSIAEDKILLSLQSAPVDLEEHEIDISAVDSIAYDILIVFAAVLHSLPFLKALQCGDLVPQLQCPLKLLAG